METLGEMFERPDDYLVFRERTKQVLVLSTGKNVAPAPIEDAFASSPVVEVNERFEKHERIKAFRLVPEEFTEENDMLTPTMKKKRRNIVERYDHLVADIYEAVDADQESPSEPTVE